MREATASLAAVSLREYGSRNQYPPARQEVMNLMYVAVLLDRAGCFIARGVGQTAGEAIRVAYAQLAVEDRPLVAARTVRAA